MNFGKLILEHPNSHGSFGRLQNLHVASCQMYMKLMCVKDTPHPKVLYCWSHLQYKVIALTIDTHHIKQKIIKVINRFEAISTSKPEIYLETVYKYSKILSSALITYQISLNWLRASS